MQVVVLGMHRSGTSFLTRFLQLMGVWLGAPDQLSPPGWGNPRGHWELSGLRDLQDAALARHGCTWSRVGPLVRAGKPVPFEPDHLAEAGRILAGLAARRPWAVKDPRSCLCFESWKHLLDAPVVLLVHRCPQAVARSLARRDGFPLVVSVALWELYNLRALQASRGMPCLKVAFEDLLADPHGQADALRAGLEAYGAKGLGPMDRDALAAFLDPAVDAARPDPREQGVYLSEVGARILGALQGPGIPDAVGDWTMDPAACQVLELFHRSQELEEALHREQAQGAALEAREARREAQSADLEARFARLEAQHADLGARRAQLEEQLDALATRHADLVREGARASAERAERDAECLRLERLVQDLAKELEVFRAGRRGQLVEAVARLLFPGSGAGLSGLVDPQYYRETYPDVAASGVDPVRHWLAHGSREGRRPRRS